MKYFVFGFWFRSLFSTKRRITYGGIRTYFKECKVTVHDTRECFQQVVPFVGIYKSVKPENIEHVSVHVNGATVFCADTDTINDIESLRGFGL
jgi:hypothetical protein